MNTRLIIFDFDGTLGDTQQIIVTTMQTTIAELHLPKRSDEECASRIGLPLNGCFESLYPTLSADEIQLCADTYRKHFFALVKNVKPKAFPGVVETLAKLKESGFALTIASSRSHKSLVDLVHDLQIDRYISYVLGADDVEHAKPNPEPVLTTLSTMGFTADQALVVGDMNVDILMGSRAGTRTCGVTYGNGTREELEQAGADHIINSIDELTEIPH